MHTGPLTNSVVVKLSNEWPQVLSSGWPDGCISWRPSWNMIFKRLFCCECFSFGILVQRGKRGSDSQDK